MRRRPRDDGNLMLLAGIVITIAFVTTALTLSQVASLERKASTESASTFAGEWRFLRERIGANLNSSVTAELRNDTFRETTLPSIVAAFRSVESEKGFDIVIRLATTLTLYSTTEASLLDPPITGSSYDIIPVNRIPIDWAKDPDATDGLIWRAPCQNPAGPSTGCISGVVLFVELSDGVSSLKEVLVFATNVS